MTSLPSYTLGRVVTALAIATTLLGSTAPNPLYPIYIAKLGIAHAQSTLIFAIYAVGTLISLLLTAWLSRHISDMRKLLVPGLLITAMGALLFGFADNLLMLLIGRFLNGFGTGAITGMGSATLIALSAPGRKHIGATIATVAFTGGAAGGPLISSAALSLGAAPTILPFLLIAALSAVGIIGFKLADWPDSEKADNNELRTEDGRTNLGLYLLACLGVMTAWTITSALMALGTDLALNVYGFTSISTAGLVTAVFQLFGGFGQAYFGRKQSFVPLIGGFSGLAFVLGLLVLLAGGDHPAMFMLLMPLFGLSYGAIFVHSLSFAGTAAAPRRRAALIATFYVGGYLANALPTIGLGVVTDRVGLTLAFQGFSLIVICLALLGIAYTFVIKNRHTFTPC
nr:MFS transporter [uncultured Cohaesibacter sp.]